MSIDDMESDEWRTAATGPQKRRLADALLSRLKNRFAPTGLLHFGQGKWYPGESLPRWSMACYWRRDEQPIWRDERWFAKEDEPTNPTVEDAERFARELASRLSVAENCVLTAYEDSWYYLWRERRLPINVDARFAKLDNEEERARLARVFEGGVNKPVGCVLPLRFAWWQADPRWTSGPWPVRTDQMFLIPGDSPMGFRLPLTSLPLAATTDSSEDSFPRDPMSDVAALPSYDRLRRANSTSDLGQLPTNNHRESDQQARIPLAPIEANASTLFALSNARTISDSDTRSDPLSAYAGDEISGFPLHANGRRSASNARHGASQHASEDEDQRSTWSAQSLGNADTGQLPYDDLIRTALCVEPREGHLYVFMPPVDRLEPYLALVAAIEDTAEYLEMPVRLEGYLPPNDYRLNHLRVAPDPGVIEVNVHPAHSWDELVNITSSVYEDAYRSRLGTERFDRDGTHTGTGGGNHVVLGGPRPSDSPFLRRPDLLRSLVGYWHNHPSLSYLFSGSFIGPTSQAPRVDEGRRDAVYELQIAFEQIPDGQECPPWLVDRVFRHLLVDITGNTHRAEFCIDKLFSPDSATGRLGLVEFRAFEMPPHAKMSLTQQLLLRALVARFWEQSYRERLVDWGTAIHDRCLLPHFLW
ncbi:MAG: transglutaminase family protein, partial [Planctomycetales bacterium]|nr:transglutaminase family protein [Planctomycetales bacterium]